MKRRFLAMLLSVAMVLTMLPVTAFAADPAGSDGIVSLAEVNATLNVRAIKSAGDNATITLKITPKNDSGTSTTAEGEEEYYYKTFDSNGNPTAPNDGDEVTTGDGAWTKYTGPFTAGTVAKVQVVTAKSTAEGQTTKLTVDKYGIADSIANALGELAVTIGADDDPNAIVVKEGNENCNDTISYYRLDAEKVEAFKTAKADWASDITLASVSETLGTAISPDSSKVTEADNGKYLVAVVVATNNLSKIGVTSVPVKFTRPFKLYAGEVASSSETTATDLIADATWDSENSKYVVTVPAGTEKVTVGTGASVEVKQGSDGSVPANSNVVTLSTDGTTTITVSIGQGQSETYDVDITPVKPVVKNGNEQLPLTRNGSTYTLTSGDPVAYTVETLTVSGEEGHPIASVQNGNATIKGTSVNVNLAVGLNTLVVTFVDAGTCTIKVNRKDADPAVALYEGTKASGTDLLEKVTPSENAYAVGVPSTVTQVTVGAKAGTIATVKYTPTGGSETTATSNTITLNEGSTEIKVAFNSDPAIEFTITVTKAAAFVPLSVTEGDDGKVVVARAEGTGEVPTPLQVVVLAKEPTWTAATTEAEVDTDTTNALVASDEYDANTTPVPAASEADQYVVVYKIDNNLVVAFGVMTVPKEARSITVNATDTDTGLLNFDSTIHEYTISIPATVAKATVAAGPGAARFDCTTAYEDNTTNVEVTAQPGQVSTVTVTFTGVSGNGVYEIKLVWAKTPGSISDDDQKVAATPTEGNVNLEEDEILQAISSTSTRNDAKGFDDPVEITATSGDDSDPADTTTVNLPASAAELLKDTGIDAKVVTDAGEVTIPSEAIKQTQPGTEDNPAAPVAIAVVVAKKTANDDAEAGIVEAAKFEVTVKKATEDGMVDAGIKDLAKPITLVFKVRKDAIGEMKNPRLAYVKPAATVGGKPTYEKLPEAPEPTFDEATQLYTFTGKTSHLSEFAVVAEEATTEPEPTGLNITDITMENVDDFTFNSSATEPFEVTAKPEATEVSITVTADNYTNVVVGSSADSATGDSPCTAGKAVKFTLSNEGKATIYVKVNGTVKYTINVSKEADPTAKGIEKITLTDKDGNALSTEVFNFVKGDTTYEVVTDDPVTVKVEGTNVSITVGDESKTSPVEVTPTEAGVKVVVTSTDDPTKTYEITLKKTESTTPVDPTAPVTKVFIGDEEQKVTFKANENGEMVSEQVLSLESTDKVVTLTVAEGAKIALDDGEFASVLVGNTYPVEVEESGDHTITVTDSEGKNPYIIKLNKKPATGDENKPTGADGEDISFTPNEEGVLEGTVTVASSASSYKLNVGAGATTVLVNGEKVDIPADGVIEIPITSAGTQRIEITNSDGTKYIVNLERKPGPGDLTITMKGSVNFLREVEISNMKTSMYYLVRIYVPESRVMPEGYSCLVLDGKSYASGSATIASAIGSEILVEEYDTMSQLGKFSGAKYSVTETVR